MNASIYTDIRERVLRGKHTETKSHYYILAFANMQLEHLLNINNTQNEEDSSIDLSIIQIALFLFFAP